MNIFNTAIVKRAGKTNLNTLIADFAEHQRPEDWEAIIDHLSSVELYSPVVSSNLELNDGEIIVEKGMDITFPTVTIQEMSLALFYVNKDDARLGKHYIRMNTADIFTIVENTDTLSGFLFYNHDESFFGIPREEFPDLRSRYGWE